MRILYHHRTQLEDAQGIHIHEMIKAFRDLGHEVEMVSLVKKQESVMKHSSGNKWNWLRRWSPNWLYELMGIAYNLYGYYHLCRVISLKKPDLIYERYSMNTFCGIWVSRKFKIPLILEVNLPLFYEKKKYGKLTFERLSRFLETWICANSTRTIVVSRAMKEYFIEEGVPDKKMTVMPNAVDPERFNSSIAGEIIRKEYRIEECLVIGFVGWFRSWHGLEMLLQVMNEEHLSERSIRLMLVGDGPEYPNLINYVTRHNLQSAVVLTGSIESKLIPLYVAAMDIPVLPGTNDYGCPMKILEYMAMGKCVVAPDKAVIKEIVEDKVTGCLFKEGDIESFKSVLSELIEDPAKRRYLGENAQRSIYERGLLWSSNAQNTLDMVFEGKMIKKTEGSRKTTILVGKDQI